jgi:hypothetical protein
MSVKYYQEIIDAIDTLLDTITDIKAVYDVEPTSITAYPCAIIVPLSHTEEYQTLKHIKRTFKIRIMVWGQLQDTSEDSQRIVRDIVDQIIDKLANNITLSGEVDFTKLTECSFDKGVKYAGMYMGDITLSAMKTYARS